MENNKEILKIENLNLEIGTVKILKDISFTVQKKEIIALLGPSGSGKSSLLKSINMLNTPSCGQIKYHNNDIQEISPMALRKKIGYVLQKPTLFGNDVMENLKYPCELHQKVFDINLVEFYLKKVNLKPDILEKKPNELSGGEQQRISLVRTLLLEPEMILLDEVTSALDEDNTLLIEELIKYENENNETSYGRCISSDGAYINDRSYCLRVCTGNWHGCGTGNDRDNRYKGRDNRTGRSNRA